MKVDSDGRTLNAGKNALSAVCSKLCILCLTFVGRKFFIQYIGIEYLGINGLFSNILTLLSMADLGLGTAMNVSLYRPIAEGDKRKQAALLHYFRRLYGFIALGVGAAGLSLLPFLDYFINMDSSIPYLQFYYVIFVSKSVVSYLFVYKSSIIFADQKSYLIHKLDMAVGMLRVAAQIAVVVLFHNYLAYLLLEVLGGLAQNLMISHIADCRYPFIRQKCSLTKGEQKDIFSDVSSVFLYKLSWSLLNGTDNILMSVLVGTVTVGLYSNYYTITSNLEAFVALLFTSLTAGVGNLIVTAGEEKRYQVFKSMQMISFWISGFLVICLLYLTQDFIKLWLGEALLLDNLTLAAIVMNVFFSTCMRPVWTFREGTGMYRQIRYIMFGTALLNLLLSVVLGKWLGVSGILFATSISKLATYFWYEPNILYKNFFHQTPLSYYWEFLKNALILIAGGVICYVPVRLLDGEGLLNWVLKALICLVVMNGLYFVRYRRTEAFVILKDKIAGFFEDR